MHQGFSCVSVDETEVCVEIKKLTHFILITKVIKICILNLCYSVQDVVKTLHSRKKQNVRSLNYYYRYCRQK